MKRLMTSLALTRLTGCATQIEGPIANARLSPTKGNITAGEVTFKTIGAKVLVTASIRGLKPNAEHGFHIHEKGDGPRGDGMSTGGPVPYPHLTLPANLSLSFSAGGR